MDRTESKKEDRKKTKVYRMNNRKMWERKMTTKEVLFPFLQFLEKHNDKVHS